MTTTRFTFTVKAAAESCGVNPRTITRHISALQEHGAAKDETGAWRIPAEALLAIGLKPGKLAPPDAVSDMSQGTNEMSVGPVTPDVRAELADLRHRAELAEGLLAAERRINEALSLALRALTPGDVGKVEHHVPIPSSAQTSLAGGATNDQVGVSDPSPHAAEAHVQGGQDVVTHQSRAGGNDDHLAGMQPVSVFGNDHVIPEQPAFAPPTSKLRTWWRNRRG